VLVVDSRLEQLRASLRAGGTRFYLGQGDRGPAFAAPQQALLVIGPPRAGKTAGLVVPNVLAAPGAVIVTSTKPDVMLALRPFGHHHNPARRRPDPLVPGRRQPVVG
jgi:type IV secretory pathway TraG/TraD family ATPase VirD4